MKSINKQDKTIISFIWNSIRNISKAFYVIKALTNWVIVQIFVQTLISKIGIEDESK